jgi:hypothetical protein
MIFKGFSTKKTNNLRNRLQRYLDVLQIKPYFCKNTFSWLSTLQECKVIAGKAKSSPTLSMYVGK